MSNRLPEQREAKDTNGTFKKLSKKINWQHLCKIKKNTNGQITVNKIQRRKLKTEQHKPYQKLGVKLVAPVRKREHILPRMIWYFIHRDMCRKQILQVNILLGETLLISGRVNKIIISVCNFAKMQEFQIQRSIYCILHIIITHEYLLKIGDLGGRGVWVATTLRLRVRTPLVRVHSTPILID